MAPTHLFDITNIDFTKVQQGVDTIEATNPHRGVMRLIDGITHESEDHWQAIAYKDIRADEFWVPGHIPGRPIFPGVLMLEAAAQLASYQTLRILTDIKFLGFGGLDEVKFRGQVVPGDRLFIMSQALEVKRRRSICRAHGYVNQKLCFEALITGMPF